MTRAETALADFLEASEQMDYARQLIASYEGHQQRALASLIDAIGRDQAADLTGVDERQIRAALALARTPTHEDKRDGDPRPDSTSRSDTYTDTDTDTDTTIDEPETKTSEPEPPMVPHTDPEPAVHAQAG
ncbi:MAG TPA: hypothetical protein VF942_06930 [Acidimicrobiales bacterium]